MRMNQTATTPTSLQDTLTSRTMANAIRALSMDAVQAANSGHPGMPLGMADVATALWTGPLKYNPDVPHWPDRDRFVLSAGHGSMLLYSVLYLTGYADMTLDEIRRFRQLGSKTCGHPEYKHAEGIETTTGPLGQGFGNAVGMALAEQLLAAQFGKELVDHYTYCVVGDGCLMEGISQESASMAAHLNLHKLIVLFDDNGISIDGPTSLTTSENQAERFRALGWDVAEIDGHDAEAVSAALKAAKTTDRPSFIACKTTIAYGSPNRAGTSASHGAPLGDAEIAATKAQLDWPYGAFEIPDNVLDAWRDAGAAHKQDYDAWQKRFDAADAATKAEFTRVTQGNLPKDWQDVLNTLKRETCESPVKEATRQSSQVVLDRLTPHMPELIGGSADLTGSNNTKAKQFSAIEADKFDARYIYYGIREHAMGAVMNGLSLHGGFIPYAGTFLVFSDYMRTPMRLSALMQQGTIHVHTHDSIGLGEDGPTHQPIEHLASLRAIPNMHVMRPADRIETIECWALAVQYRNTPSVLALSRQGLPQVRLSHENDNLCARGGYILRDAADAQAVIIATGSEVHLAVEAAEKLTQDNIAVKIVSMPCMELFFEQTAQYRAQVLGEGLPRIAIEAGCEQGWHKLIGEHGVFIGMDSFGSSAPAPELYKHFGITTDALIKAVKSVL